MTATVYLERARDWARMLEDREAAATGEPLRQARVAVARKIGVASGTLENLRKGRLKSVPAHVFDFIRSGVLRALEAELRHVEFEIQIARQTGLDAASSDFQSALASQARLRSALNLPEGGA